MATKAIVLAAAVNTTAATAGVDWMGGRGCLVVNATTYPTTCQLQIQGPSGAWINVGAAVTADVVQALDLPAGQYRMNLATGTTAGLFANLVSVPYHG